MGWRAGRLFVLALAARTAYLLVGYEMGFGAHRYEVESAAFAFVAAGAILQLTMRPRVGPASAGPASAGLPARDSMAIWAAFVMAAFLLYWPALFVGLMSDDYGLILHAAAWRVGPVTRDLFRPVPLLAWSVLIQSGGGARALHAMNIALHGTNAYLATRVAAAYPRARPWRLVVGLLVLTAPLAAEAVVWNAGVFDLMATTMLLTSVLVAQRYADGPSPRQRIVFVSLGVAAVLSKETAAVGPVLLLLDAWLRRALSRPLVLDIGVLFGLTALVSVGRLLTRFGAVSPPVTKYVVQRTLFGAFGSLAAPWHQDVIAASAILPIVSGVGAIVLLAILLVRRGSLEGRRLAVAGTVWIVVSILPVFPILFVPSDLQQSRYLYLPGFGWAVLLIAAAVEAGKRRAYQAIVLAYLGLLVIVSAYGVHVHLRHWVRAAALRDAVERAARTDPRITACHDAVLNNLPDNFEGAYIFRTNAPEAFARDVGMTVSVGTATGPCSFRWDEARAGFRPAGEQK